MSTYKKREGVKKETSETVCVVVEYIYGFSLGVTRRTHFSYRVDMIFNDIAWLEHLVFCAERIDSKISSTVNNPEQLGFSASRSKIVFSGTFA